VPRFRSRGILPRPRTRSRTLLPRSWPWSRQVVSWSHHCRIAYFGKFGLRGHFTRLQAQNQRTSMRLLANSWVFIAIETSTLQLLTSSFFNLFPDKCRPTKLKLECNAMVWSEVGLLLLTQGNRFGLVAVRINEVRLLNAQTLCPVSREYHRAAAAAVQTWRPCPLWEPDPH